MDLNEPTISKNPILYRLNSLQVYFNRYNLVAGFLNHQPVDIQPLQQCLHDDRVLAAV